MNGPDPLFRAGASCADDTEPGVLTVAEARRRIAATITPVSTVERKDLRGALGRVLAGEVVSPRDVPGHTNSAMDGYALDGGLLGGEGPLDLVVAGAALAGAPYAAPCPSGQCVRIMTGAPMPAGTDTVVMQERVQVLDDGRVRLPGSQRPGANVRQAGEDVARGATVLPAGHRLAPADLGVLASLGLSEVAVRRRPRVAFFSTGDELRPVGEPLGAGQVYDSNRYTLYGMLARLDLELMDLGSVPDDPAQLSRALNAASAAADVVITSGGVSVGEADFIRTVVGDRGTLDFWKIAMKPGRPLTFGWLGEALFFGLPGNPVAVMVTFYQFVQPALHCLAGAGWRDALTVPAVCREGLRKRPGRTEFRRGILSRDADGALGVAPAGSQGSGILTSMSRADCLIVLPDACGDLPPGASVQVQPFEALV